MHIQLNELWTSVKGKPYDKDQTALALKRWLDAYTSSPWHVLIGPHDFVTNIRYRSRPPPARCFLFANTHHQLRALVFQSSPRPPSPSAPCPSPLPVTSRKTLVYRTNLPSEGHEGSPPLHSTPSLSLLLALATHALHNAEGEPVKASVALKAALSGHPACGGRLWQVVLARDSIELGIAVEAQPESFLDARVHGGGKVFRMVLWSHDLPMSSWDWLGGHSWCSPRLPSLPSLSSFLTSHPTQWVFGLLLVLAVGCVAVAQAEEWGLWRAWGCPACHLRPETDKCDMARAARCSSSEEDMAGMCQRWKGRLRSLGLAALTAAWVGRAWQRRPLSVRAGRRSGKGGKGKHE